MNDIPANKYDPLAIKLGQHEWMTLRDYFASKILGTLYCDMDDIKGMARMSYEIADAMLAERAKQ